HHVHLLCSSLLNVASSFTLPPTIALTPLSLHDALPICGRHPRWASVLSATACEAVRFSMSIAPRPHTSPLTSSPPNGSRVNGERSEEHTSELQSHLNLVCRLLLEKKKVLHRNDDCVLL